MASLYYFDTEVLEWVASKDLGRSRIPGMLDDPKYNDFLQGLLSVYKVGRWQNWANECKAGRLNGEQAEIGQDMLQFYDDAVDLMSRADIQIA